MRPNHLIRNCELTGIWNVSTWPRSRNMHTQRKISLRGGLLTLTARERLVHWDCTLRLFISVHALSHPDSLTRVCNDCSQSQIEHWSPKSLPHSRSRMQDHPWMFMTQTHTEFASTQQFEPPWLLEIGHRVEPNRGSSTRHSLSVFLIMDSILSRSVLFRIRLKCGISWFGGNSVGFWAFWRLKDSKLCQKWSLSFISIL